MQNRSRNIKNRLYFCRVKSKKAIGGFTMATITLKYDARNVLIKKLLEVIVSLGGQIGTPAKAKEKTGYDATLEAMKEVKEGKVVRYKSFDDFKKKMYAL